MKKICILTLASFLLISQAIGQAKLVEKVVKKSAADVIIPFERYVLPNGLNVILHEDKSDPLVHVDVTYHVGSAREEISKSGFAHFFEHMMFQGSDNVADEQHFKIITEAGGSLNGTTNRDRTNYFETVPKNQLEKMLWLEADRMGFLLDAVTQEKFEVQRATVKNERGQNYDNRPYGLVQETLAKNLYPYGHPYSWLTIGYVEDLNRVNVQDLKNFFLRWYGPNNAVLTIGGDINKVQTLKWVEQYFNTIPMGPKVEKATMPMPTITSDRYVTMTDNYAKNQMLTMALPTVPAHHPDEDALDCLAQIFGGDNSSLLYQSLVKTQRATRAGANQPTDELAGTMQFTAMPTGKSTLADMETAIRAAIKAVETRGVNDDDIKKFVAGREASAIYGLESVSGKVSQLASGFTFSGDASTYSKRLAQLKKITKADVLRVYNKYIKGKNFVILNTLTKDKQEGKAGTDNYIVDATKNVFPTVNYNGLVYNKAKDNFDRGKMPPSGSNPTITIPKYNQTKDANTGIATISSKQADLPLISIDINMPGGRFLEQNNLGKLGITNVFAQMMDEDTKKRSSEELSTLLDKLGSSISFYNTNDKFYASINCLKKNFDATLKIFEEKLLQPLFTQDNLDRIKNQTIANLKNSNQNANYLAGVAYSKLLYSADNILGLPANGIENTLNNISLSDIENHYNKTITCKDAQVTIVGDINGTEGKKILQILKKLPNRMTILPIPNPAKNISSSDKKIYVVNVAKAAQTEFRVGYVTNLLNDAFGEYYKATLMNFPLGGAFNSRVNLNLRENKGWTYGARANFSANKYTGTYTFSSGIKTPSTDSALYEVIKEMNGYNANGITAEELSFLKNAISQSDARKYETLGQKAGFLSNMVYNNYPSDYVTQQNNILNNISKSEIDVLAKKYIQENKLLIVLAGDKEKIAPGLEKMGYTIVEVDNEGNIK
jgi:zinc protease